MTPGQIENSDNNTWSLASLQNEAERAVSHLSRREYFFFWGLVIILLASTIGILKKINQSFMVRVAIRGGEITEGIVGTPRFVNPVLANSPADQDLVALVYSGLMRKNTDGTLVPDLALKYEVSKDGLAYTFTLKDKIYFHDGKPVTPDDILFTIDQVRDPIVKNSKKGNWDRVAVSKLDEKTVKFTLQQSYASFLENTTLPIMPAHLWKGSPIELNDLNIRPIGSGPYRVKGVGKRDTGLIDYYELIPFKKFNLGQPYLKKITLRFYPNENDQIKALLTGEVDQIGSITPANAKVLEEKGYRLETTILPRVFGLFFNQSQNQIFTDKNVMTAIDLAIDKDSIITYVLSGFGTIANSPIPKSMANYGEPSKEDQATREEKVKKAEEILEKSGWKKNAEGFLQKTTTEKKSTKGGKKNTVNLEFSISTGNAPELARSAELIKQNLEAIGIKVEVRTFEIGNLNQGVIRPRKYDTLLFGQIINHQSDLFAFWHSSQRKDPGLNVAMYANVRADKILEEAFIAQDETVRAKEYAEFENEIKKDMPAVFLYSPSFVYVVSKDIKGFYLNHIVAPAERFLDSYSWYVKTENVWKIFE